VDVGPELVEQAALFLAGRGGPALRLSDLLGASPNGTDATDPSQMRVEASGPPGEVLVSPIWMLVAELVDLALASVPL
jgi:hypothetical protein